MYNSVIMDRQEQREKLVLKAMFLDKGNLEEIELLDRMVCEALGLDPEEIPPHFIMDSLSA